MARARILRPANPEGENVMIRMGKTLSQKIAGMAIFFGGMIFSSAARADCEDGGLGTVMCNIVVSSEDMPGLFSGACYLFGVVIGALGIAKLYEHVISPSNVPVWDSIKRFAVAGGLFALPIVLDAAWTTVAADIDTYDQTGFNAGPTSVSEGLDVTLLRFMSDIWFPVSYLIAGFTYLAGIILVIVGIFRMLKRTDDGVRGPGGIGTIFCFLVGGTLLSLDAMIGAFSTSLFDDSSVTTYASLQYTTGMTPEEVQHVHNVISAVIAFMMIVGIISFVRGLFILKDYTNGDGQASLMASFTHLFGGALAINLGPLLNAVQTTLHLNDFGIVFS